MPIHPRYCRPSWLFCCAIFVATAEASRADEVAQLTPQKLLVEVKVVEVHVTKLRNLGFAWSEIRADGEARQRTIEDLIQSYNRDPKNADHLSGFLKALEQNSLAHTLAEPTIATLDGRPASIAVGGTQLDIVPIVLGNDRVRLECRIEVAAPPKEASRLTTRADAVEKPPLVRVDGATELEFGKTSIISHARIRTPSSAPKVAETELLVLARVEYLQSGRLSKAPASATDAKYRELK